MSELSLDSLKSAYDSEVLPAIFRADDIRHRVRGPCVLVYPYKKSGDGFLWLFMQESIKAGARCEQFGEAVDDAIKHLIAHSY